MKCGLVPERLAPMGTWEQPQHSSSGVSVHGEVGRQGMRAEKEGDSFLIHTELMYKLTYLYPRDNAPE